MKQCNMELTTPFTYFRRFTFRAAVIVMLLHLLFDGGAYAASKTTKPRADSLVAAAVDTQKVRLDRLIDRIDTLFTYESRLAQSLTSDLAKVNSTQRIAGLPQWLSAIASFIAVAAALWIAIFAERVKLNANAPKLSASINAGPPDCVEIPTTVGQTKKGEIFQVPSYWYRIRVNNFGKSHARNVTVFLVKLERQSENGKWGDLNEFLPLHLVWANTQMSAGGGQVRSVKAIIPKDSFAHCDLGFAFAPEHNVIHRLDFETSMLFHLETDTNPNTRSNILRKGTYRLTAQISAENTDSSSQEFLITNSGEWTDNAVEMFTKALTVEMA